jgi:cell division septation protein DedD
VENKQTYVQALLAVARGAFRFTTDARAKLTSRREVDIRVATVTAGIRGTDLWGKSSDDRDIVCLIEGAIQVQRESEAPVAMNQALQFYIAPKAAGQRDAARPAQLASVSAEQLKQWATETEIAAGQGAARRGGKWKVVAASSPDQAAALGVYDKLRAEGYAASIFPTGTPDKRSYEVRIGGLPSKAEADALASKVEAITGAKPRAST